MRLKPALAVAAALVVLALVIRQVTQAVHRTFSGRPGVARLARATPAYQNGLTLMEIDNVSPDHIYSFSGKGQEDTGGSSPGAPAADTGLWIKLPPSVSPPANCSDSTYPTCQNLLTLTAHASDGREMPLRWRTSGSRSSSDPFYILTSIPASYPDTVRWTDVTLEDHHGDSATWRILDLPPMQHVLAPPVTPQTTFHQGNITVTADAYRGDDPLNRTGPRILFDLNGTISQAAHQWEVGGLTETREWEPANAVSPDAGATYGTSKMGRQVRFDVSRQVIGWNRTEPYLQDDHWVRLGAKLQEFETYDETVTFHNVSVVHPQPGSDFIAAVGPETVRSASGIVVTLEDVQHQQVHFLGTANAVSLKVTYPQTRHLPRLTGSPLWRRYKRPVTVSASLPKVYEGYGGSSEDTQETCSFRPKKPLPKVIVNFPVIIRQRVDLRTVPMTFTLPVLDKEPT